MYSFAYLFIYVFICSIIWELTRDQVLLFFLRPTKTSTVSASGELMFWQRTKSDITCFRRNVGQDTGSTQSSGSVLLGELAFQIRSLRAALGGQLVFPGHGGTDRGVPPAEEFIKHERTDASDGHATACATGEVMKGVLLGWGIHSQKPLSSKAISAFKLLCASHLEGDSRGQRAYWPAWLCHHPVPALFSPPSNICKGMVCAQEVIPKTSIFVCSRIFCCCSET